MNKHQPSDVRVRAVRQGFPLGLIFITIALASALLALDVSVLNDKVFQESSTETLLGSFGVAGLVGGMLGAIIGLYHYDRTMGVLLGGATGVVLLPLILPVLIVKEDHTLQVIVATVIGCSLILGLAAAIRLGVWKR